MNTQDKTSTDNNIVTSPTVGIDALDELFIKPMREFFELYGCQVFVNSPRHSKDTYHLIVGDLLYVKDIVDNQVLTSTNTMAIIWNVNEHDPALPTDASIKCALIDPQPITGELLGSLCQYLFTGSQHIKNFQTHMPEEFISVQEHTQKKLKKKEESPKQREQGVVQEPSTKKEDTSRIANTIAQVFHPDNELSNETPLSTTHAKTSKQVILMVRFIFFGIAILLMPYIVYLISMVMVIFSMYQQSECITSTTSCSGYFTHNTAPWIRTARTALHITPIQGTQTIRHQELITACEKISIVLQQAAEINTIASELTNTLFTMDLSTQDLTPPVVYIEKIKTQIFSLHTNLDLAYRYLERVSLHPAFPFTSPFVRTKLEQGMTRIQNVRSNMQTAERLLLLYPYVSGYKQPMKFLVLLQNNTELRPTGGFIGSLLKVTIEEGAITTMTVEDVYTVDGQLKGHVNPPDPIRDVLKQEHWYLRDSNWNPDFMESAQKALWFYEKETGETVDGVIALNSSVMVKLLHLTGPVTLLDGGDEIREDNFYAKSTQYTQTDFFPGSTQKKDFLGNLTSTLLTTVLQKNRDSGMYLFELIDQSLRERELQMYLVDPEAQRLVTQFEWAGRLPAKQTCVDEKNLLCVFDYYAAIEANLGVNKANYYVKRHDTRDITIDTQGRVNETITRTITNTAPVQQANAQYKNYMRFYLPPSVHIKSFTLNGQSIPAKSRGKNTVPLLPYGEFDTTNPNVTVIASVFDVSPQETATVVISYDYIHQAFVSALDTSFVVMTQKQSGVDTVPTTIRIQYPDTWKTKEDNQTTASTLANNGYLEYNSTMLQDSNIHIYFIKKEQ